MTAGQTRPERVDALGRSRARRASPKFPGTIVSPRASMATRCGDLLRASRNGRLHVVRSKRQREEVQTTERGQGLARARVRLDGDTQIGRDGRLGCAADWSIGRVPPAVRLGGIDLPLAVRRHAAGSGQARHISAIDLAPTDALRPPRREALQKNDRLVASPCGCRRSIPSTGPHRSPAPGSPWTGRSPSCASSARAPSRGHGGFSSTPQAPPPSEELSIFAEVGHRRRHRGPRHRLTEPQNGAREGRGRAATAWSAVDPRAASTGGSGPLHGDGRPQTTELEDDQRPDRPRSGAQDRIASHDATASPCRQPDCARDAQDLRRGRCPSAASPAPAPRSDRGGRPFGRGDSQRRFR